jgi:transcriptional regulator with XRE-family HTH domain
MYFGGGVMMKGFENNLKKVMKQQDVTGFELFRRTGIAPSTISGIVNNRIIPFPGWCKRIAEALKVSESALFPNAGNVRSERVV